MSWRKGQAYAQDLCDLVLTTPGVLREVAQRFGVSQSYVCRARARRELCLWVCLRASHGIEVGTTTLHKTLG